MRGRRGDDAEGVRSALCARDRVAVERESADDELTRLGLVFDDERSQRRAAESCLVFGGQG